MNSPSAEGFQSVNGANRTGTAAPGTEPGQARVVVPIGPVSALVRARIKAAGATYAANDTIAAHLQPGDVDHLEDEVTTHVSAMLDALVIDTEADHNTRETARRVARMYLREVFAGRYTPRPQLTDFPNAGRLDEIYTVGPVAIRSACSHHLCPVEGSLWCGVIPGEKVIGLSKFSRLAKWIMARPQIQEEAIVQLADQLEQLIKPKGLAVVMRLRHSCMTWRGVQEHDTTMATSVTRGILREGHAARAEFFAAIQAQGFSA